MFASHNTKDKGRFGWTIITSPVRHSKSQIQREKHDELSQVLDPQCKVTSFYSLFITWDGTHCHGCTFGSNLQYLFINWESSKKMNMLRIEIAAPITVCPLDFPF